MIILSLMEFLKGSDLQSGLLFIYLGNLELVSLVAYARLVAFLCRLSCFLYTKQTTTTKHKHKIVNSVDQALFLSRQWTGEGGFEAVRMYQA